ncbi:MAG: alpha/beta hydrolase [Propionibacteriaceae bacterium]|nr:alpha/beta hydrolase [Propionibacteriaceae bacterium]
MNARMFRRLLRRLGVGFTAAYFALVSRTAPKLATKQAAWRWLLLPQNAGRRMDNRPGSGQVEQIPGENGALVTECWGSIGAPVVYLLHGWGGWHGQLGAFVVPLAAAGYLVVGVNTASHGMSAPGRFGSKHSSGPEMLDSFEAIVRHWGSAHGVIAHSLGCVVACKAIVDDKLATQKLVLVSPSENLYDIVAQYGKRLRLAPRALDALLPTIEDISGGTLAEADICALAATGKLPDALIVHDLLDKEVPYAAAQLISANWPGARLHTTQGLGHHRILKDPAVVALAVEQISQSSSAAS